MTTAERPPRTPGAVGSLLDQLTLEDKVALLTGQDLWRTHAIERIGLAPVVFSDGPVGVRGQVWDERRPSLNLPSPTALAASWDVGLAGRYGRVLGDEARDKGVHVVLAPTVNLHRSPLAGRHFEAFSEDPHLTGAMAAALVTGLQSTGVGACVKHYVANDYETDRFTASSEVDERTLHEVYLRAFEPPVVEAGAWSVMSAYNRVNGITMSEHPLLTRPLKEAWGFDGVVVSDWTGVRSLASASTGQDLVMPGPDGPWGTALLEALATGDIHPRVVDDKVRRLLVLAGRVGALPSRRPRQDPVTGAAERRSLAREAAAEGSVLLANDAVLPLDADRLTRLAVVGHNATLARTQGGGSATVLPRETVSPLSGIRDALPGVEVTHAIGAVVEEGVTGLPLAQVVTPDTGRPGARVRFLDHRDRVIHEEHRHSTDLVWFGGDAPVREAAYVEVEFLWTPAETDTVALGLATVGHGEVAVDGCPHVSGTGVLVTRRLGASPLAPPALTAALPVTAGEQRHVWARIRVLEDSLGAAGLLSLRLGTAADPSSGDVLMDEAVRTAAQADVAVVVVGTSSDVESEGFDRAGLELPGRQDELVRAVAGTGTPTVVVVNAGAPVLLPWRDRVGAVLVSWFGGQEMGHALADVLLGAREPGGRLPTTWPASADPPVLGVIPSDGRLEYSEGIHVGYRAWLRAEARPAYPFGHGLGYTTWEMSGLDVRPPATGCDGLLSQQGSATLEVHNTGERPGKHVVQVYLSRPISRVDRPVRWLAGHSVVRAAPGERRTVVVPLPWRAFSHWEPGRGWQVEAGEYRVQVGSSVADPTLTSAVTLGGDWDR